jgi:hypothetical protein
VTDYGIDGRGSIPSKGEIFVSSAASRPALGPIQPPIKWVHGKISTGVKLTTNLQLVPRSRIVELYLHTPIRVHGIMLNLLRTGTTLLYTGVKLDPWDRREERKL